MAQTPLGNNMAQKWKFGGKELDDSYNGALATYDFGARNYYRDLGRWMNIDPWAEKYIDVSPYNYAANNPVFFVDPDGRGIIGNPYALYGASDPYGNEPGIQRYEGGIAKNSREEEDDRERERERKESQGPKDDITVNSNGVVVGVVRNDKPNRFFDEQGNELKFNDSENVDEPYMSGKWQRGDRVFISVSLEQMNDAINDAGPIWQRWSANLNIMGVNGAGAGFWLWSMAVAAEKGHGDFDFAENYLATLIDNPSKNMEWNRSRTSYNDGAGFFRFGNSNTIYNLYDAGNYMWGRAMGVSGFTYGEARFGSRANEGFFDTEADQRAIKNGFNNN